MFKVGDKVRVTDFKGADAYYINNKVGTIIQIPSDSGIWDCLVDIPPQGGIFTSTPFDFCELTLVKEFKVGDRVKVVDYTNVITGTKDDRYLGKVGNVLHINFDMITVDIPSPLLKTSHTNYFAEELELVKEFGVGARVKVKSAAFNSFIIGKTGTIIAIGEEMNKHTVTLDNVTDCPEGTRYQTYYFYENELELID